jgi:hypothetical protein
LITRPSQNQIIFFVLLAILSSMIGLFLVPLAFAHEYELEKPVMCSYIEYNGNCYPELYFTIDTENRADSPYDTWTIPPTVIVGEEIQVGCTMLETVDTITLELTIYDNNGNIVEQAIVADPSFEGWPFYTFKNNTPYTIECHAHNHDIYVEEGLGEFYFDPVIVLRDIVIPQSLESEERKSKSEMLIKSCESLDDSHNKISSNQIVLDKKMYTCD